MTYNEIQLTGLHKLVRLKYYFTKENQHWLNDANFVFSGTEIQYTHALGKLVNTFCEYDLPDNDYMSIHLEASHYGKDNTLEETLQTIQKVCKHLTYIIWTDRLVDGYLNARVKDLTIHLLLSKIEMLLPLVIQPTT